MERKLYSGLDIGKLIASVLVVLLHAVETSAWVPAGVKFIATRFAVPFFFITSGFFFYNGLKKASDHKRYFIAYEKNLIKILIVWELIYLPFTIHTYLEKYAGVSTIRFIFLLLRRIIVIGAGPYWYLVSLIWAAAFLYICFYHDNKKILISGIIIGLGLEISYSCFQGVLSPFRIFSLIFRVTYVIWSFEANFLMFGIPFMGIGYLLAQKNVTIPIKVSIAVFLLTTVLRILEYELPHILPGAFWQENSISLAFIVQAIAFFLWMKEWTPPIKGAASLTIRQLSSCIYYTHMIFLYEIIDPLMDRYTSLPTYHGIMVFPKVIVTLLMCLLFFAVIKKINNKHLMILING